MKNEFLEKNTGWLVSVLGLQLYTIVSRQCIFFSQLFENFSYQTAGRLLMCALASDLECNIVGSVALELESSRRSVIEIFI